MICGRCHTECNGFTGSYFDTANICFRCEGIERSHPAYEEALRVESEHVARGNYNFRGVSVPADLMLLCATAARAEVKEPVADEYGRMS
jgi:hypothetical protein